MTERVYNRKYDAKRAALRHFGENAAEGTTFYLEAVPTDEGQRWTFRAVVSAPQDEEDQTVQQQAALSEGQKQETPARTGNKRKRKLVKGRRVVNKETGARGVYRGTDQQGLAVVEQDGGEQTRASHDELRYESSGEFIRRCVLEQVSEGRTNIDDDAILAKVQRAFPYLNTQKSDVSWNKTRLRKEGYTVPKRRSGRPNGNGEG